MNSEFLQQLALLSNLASAEAQFQSQEQLSSTQTRTRTRTTPECPGLSRVTSPSYKWVVPYGSTSAEVTYCEACSKELKIAGNAGHANDCNCDSFMIKNKADNGVFNVSFWNTNLKKIYETSVSDTDGVYYVTIPSGGKFHVLIKTHGLKNQVFRHEVVATNSGTDNEYVIHPECSEYIHDSTFIGNDRDDVYYYIDSNKPEWNVLDSDDRISKYKIVKPGDSLTININLYDIALRDFMSETNVNHGTYTLENNVIKPKTYGNDGLSKEKVYYDNDVKLSVPSRCFKPYTNKPLKMKFIFITDSKPNVGPIVDTSKLFNSMISKLINGTKAKINAKYSEIKKLENNIKLIDRLNEEINELKAKLKNLPEDI